MALMITACSSNDIEQTAPQPSNRAEGIPFTATISIGESATTRALSEDATNNKIVTTWAAGEKVALIHNDVIDVVEVQSVSDGLATLTGTLTGSPANNDAVTIIYPSSAVDDATKDIKADLLAAQDGTLATIAEKYDVRKGAGTLNVGATATLYGNVSLTNQFAIVKFSLTDGTNALDATQFIIKDGSDNVLTTVIPTSANSELYVAMAPASTSNFKFEATDGTSTYAYSKASATIEKGKFYQSPITMTNVALSIPLTLEAIEAGTIHVTFKEGLILPNPITYTKNGVEYSGGTTNFDIEVVAGDIVSFHSTNAVLAQLVGYEYKYMNIHPTNRCYIYGNVMSLIDDQGDFAADKVIGGDLAFEGLFNQADKLENHPTKELLLPATTLTYNCYSMMFANCKALTKAPNLPAAELKESCYYNMFKGCVGLTEGPIMSATTLASLCCYGMFNNCTNLVKAPDLLATTLAPCCYQMMFSGCSSLNYVKCLAMDIGDANIYSLDNWLNNVSATGTLVVSSGATWAEAGTNGIPAGWTVTSE